MIDKLQKTLGTKQDELHKQTNDKISSVVNEITKLYSDTTEKIKIDHFDLKSDHLD